MSLSEIMSSAKLTVWPIAALVLFLLAFAIIAIRTLGRGNMRAQEEASRLPFEEAPAQQTPNNNRDGGAA